MDVLVVCTANIARSPLAEAMVRARLDHLGVSVSSAGTRGRVGDPPASGSVALAGQRGLDITGHRSRPATPDLIAGADLVLTMSERHRERCSPLATGAAARTFTIEEFVRLLEVVPPGTPTSGGTDRLLQARDAAHRARASSPRGPDAEDVADPIRLPWEAWLTMGEHLDLLVGRLGAALDRPG